MIVSTKGRYALRVMIDLAEHRSEKYVPLKEVAARQEISEKYLENILKVTVVPNGKANTNTYILYDDDACDGRLVCVLLIEALFWTPEPTTTSCSAPSRTAVQTSAAFY